jgi:serine/threonine protein kinase
LKPKNIIVSQRNQWLKIADFGIATKGTRKEIVDKGTPFYLSPEAISGLPYPFLGM